VARLPEGGRSRGLAAGPDGSPRRLRRHPPEGEALVLVSVGFTHKSDLIIRDLTVYYSVSIVNRWRQEMTGVSKILKYLYS
jgi:hypothetical protein